MKDLIEEAKRLALGMALIWFLLFTFAALGNSVITAFYGMRWVEMDGQDRIMVAILIFVNWATVMMAFFSKAISRAAKGENPITDVDDKLIRRSEYDRFRQTTVRESAIPPKPITTPTPVTVENTDPVPVVVEHVADSPTEK